MTDEEFAAVKKEAEDAKNIAAKAETDLIELRKEFAELLEHVALHAECAAECAAVAVESDDADTTSAEDLLAEVSKQTGFSNRLEENDERYGKDQKGRVARVRMATARSHGKLGQLVRRLTGEKVDRG
jgi:DNA gyrase/topoisomerase IV subunit A